MFLTTSKKYSDDSLDYTFCSGQFAEADITVDHRVRPDRNSSGVGQSEFAENDLVMPDLTKEILEYLDRQLFTGTAAVAETKRRKASIVADRLRLTDSLLRRNGPNWYQGLSSHRRSL
jgi:hypothetical protein